MVRGLCALLLVAVLPVFGGGSGLNVLVVANQASQDSLELANYYLEQRQVPPANLLRIDWRGGRAQWTLEEFSRHLLGPLTNALKTRNLEGQIDYALLSMDIPYRVYQTGDSNSGQNSTTSALFYGFKPDGPPEYENLPASCNLPAASSNAYAAAEVPFRTAKATQPGLLAAMVTSSNLAQAKRVIDTGTASDRTFPLQPVYLVKTSDRLRNIRYLLYDDTLFNTRLLGYPAIVRTNSDSVDPLAPAFGYSGGLAAFNVSPGIFVPGAMADQLTSYGGVLFEPNDQTTLLAFLNAGAAASYGTVVEPCSYLEKFPDAQNYFYQARGFNLVESYYQSVLHPYQGLVVGEPLASPFGIAPGGAWLGLTGTHLLAGLTNLSWRLETAGASRPVGRVELFLDGQFERSLRKYAPAGDKSLRVEIAGRVFSLPVNTNVSMPELARALTDTINAAAEDTRVFATAHGDRVELQSHDPDLSAADLPLHAFVTAELGGETSATFVESKGFLDTAAQAFRSFSVTNIPGPGDYLGLQVFKTNGQRVSVSVTNSSGNLTLAQLARDLFAAVNAHPDLASPDGLQVEDVNMHEDPPYNLYVYGTNDHSGEFNLRARSPGLGYSKISVSFLASGLMAFTPGGTNQLDENIEDLRPRAHLYLAHGVTNAVDTEAIDTRNWPDGYHRLELVLSEGTSVETQARLGTEVLVRNHNLTASLEPVNFSTNAAMESDLVFQVQSNEPGMAQFELLGTGGRLAAATNRASVRLSVPGTQLGAGRHLFAALVTTADGRRFRTAPRLIRVERTQPAFELKLGPPLPTLRWEAVPGRTYEILGGHQPWSATALLGTVTATNSAAQWADADSLAQRFYRVRVK